MITTATQETIQIKLVNKMCPADRGAATALLGKDVLGYMKTQDGKIITTTKPRIEKSFWFGESGYDFQEKVELASKASRDQEYFKQKNIAHAGFPSTLAKIQAALDGDGNFFLFKTWKNQPVYSVRYFAKDKMLDPYSKMILANADREMTREELQTYKELTDLSLKAFERRLNTYLKRYGLSKCSYDTYWVDR